MNVYIKLKADVIKTSAFLIIIYYFFVASDLYTTWIVTPDFRYETNWFIHYFNINWKWLIILVSIATITISCTYLLSILKISSYINSRNYDKNKISLADIIKKNKISFFVISIFYSHFFISIFVTINNLLNYILLHKRNSVLFGTAVLYGKFENIFYPYYSLVSQFFVALIGLIYAIRTINGLRK